MPPVCDDRRLSSRHLSKAIATVIRETDRERRGIPADVLNVSFGGFALLMPMPLPLGEHVAVDLHNPVQGVVVWRRARVQHVEADGGEGFRVGCAVSNRLSPREVRALKSSADETLPEFVSHKAKQLMHVG
jgi:hypothetical protein